MNTKEQKKCYLCQCEEFDKIKGIVRDNRHLRVYKCRQCSLISLDTADHISNDFYKTGLMHNGIFNPTARENHAYPDDLRRFNFLKNKLNEKVLIDFGCGAGGFLKLARGICEKVYGVELDEQQRNYLSSQGLAIREKISEIYDKADYITLFHVLEHLENPIGILQELKKYLKSDKSEIIIEVPNANDALISLYHSKAFSHFTWWSCHLFTFNKNNLKLLAEKAGYKINYIKKIQRYGIFNHLYWLIKGKPGGHQKFAWARFTPVEFIYTKLLAMFDKTDTIIFSISKV